MFENIQALNQQILLEVLEKEEKKLESGIILSGSSVDSAMKNMRRGRIVSLGDKVESSFLVEGKVVLYSRFVGTEVGDKHILVLEKDLIGLEKN